MITLIELLHYYTGITSEHNSMSNLKGKQIMRKVNISQHLNHPSAQTCISSVEMNLVITYEVLMA
jgi:hypothetical protein